MKTTGTNRTPVRHCEILLREVGDVGAKLGLLGREQFRITGSHLLQSTQKRVLLLTNLSGLLAKLIELTGKLLLALIKAPEAALCGVAQKVQERLLTGINKARS